MNFDEWFNGQFGPEPEPGKELDNIRQEVYRAQEKVTECEVRYRAKREWFARQDAALKAWIARETYLKEEAECDSGK